LTQTIDSPINQSYFNFGYSTKVSPDGTMLVIIGTEIYVYNINTSGQYTYTATLESITTNIGNWSVASNYGFGSGVPNQFIALNNANNRLFIGNTRINSEIYNSSGMVYTFSCFQNPSFKSIAINTGGGSGSSGGSS
jgi:hypothetical protein